METELSGEGAVMAGLCVCVCAHGGMPSQTNEEAKADLRRGREKRRMKHFTLVFVQGRVQTDREKNYSKYSK